MITTFTSATSATLVYILSALLLWFLVRKKYRRVWFPLISIFNIGKTRLPRIRLRVPPLFAFLCFLLVSGAALLFSLRPHSVMPVDGEPRKLHLYLFIDFSPSISARVTLNQYREFLLDVYRRLQPLGELTIGTSHQHSTQKYDNHDAFAAQLQQLSFHSEGLIMTSVLRAQLSQLKTINRIIIISDRDRHTWHNFHWQHLSDSLSVQHLEVPQRRQASSNLYLQSVAAVAEQRFATHRFAVEVAAAGNLTAPQNFTLSVYRERTKITELEGKINIGQRRVLLPLQFPHSAALQQQKHLRLHLQAAREDAIALDNDFFFTLDNFMPSVVIAADLYGERLIDDPLFQLQTTFEVLGFKVIRLDRVPHRATPADLWVLAFGKNFTLQQHCPTFARGQQIWLLPQAAQVAETEVCRCYQQLRKLAPKPCNSLAQALAADDAKQMPQLPFYRKHNLTVFAIPLYAQPQTGLDYAGIPVLVQQLLQQQGLGIKPARQRWPRHDDIFSATQAKPSNVPRGESLLQELTTAQLPPALLPHRSSGKLTLPRYREDARWWIQALLLLAASAMLLEILGRLWEHRQRRLV